MVALRLCRLYQNLPFTTKLKLLSIVTCFRAVFRCEVVTISRFLRCDYLQTICMSTEQNSTSGVTSNFGPPCKKIIRAPSSLTTGVSRNCNWWGPRTKGPRTEAPLMRRRHRDSESLEGGKVWGWGTSSANELPQRGSGGPKAGFDAFGNQCILKKFSLGDIVLTPLPFRPFSPPFFLPVPSQSIPLLLSFSCQKAAPKILLCVRASGCTVSSPSGVRGGSPAAYSFLWHYSPENASGNGNFWLPSSAEEVKFQAV